MIISPPTMLGAPLADADSERDAIAAMTNEAAEQAVIGCLLLHPEATGLCATILTDSDFSRKRLGRIFAEAVALHEAGIVVEQIALLEACGRAGITENQQDEADVLVLVLAVPSVFLAESYAKQVEDLAARRRLVIAARQIAGLAQRSKDAATAIDAANDTLARAGRRKGQTYAESMASIMGSYYEKLDAVSSGTQAKGIPTGLFDLDRVTGGLQRKDLILLAARPSLGKSSMALGIARHAAQRGHPVGVVSLEMSRDALANRLVSMDAGIDGRRILGDGLGNGEMAKVAEAVGRMSELPIYIDDTPGLTIGELKHRAATIRARHGLQLLIIDYLQLLRGSGNGRDSRVNEISEISRQCKAIARELDVAVLAVCQLSRAVEQRESKRPLLSDLRDSGQLEQDADIVVFLHREDNAPPKAGEAIPVHLTVAKHRSGPLAEFTVQFVPHLTSFHSAAPPYREGAA